MSEDNFDIGNDYEETDFEMDVESDDESSKLKATPVKQKHSSRRRLEDLLEAQQLQRDLKGYDELLRDNTSVYEDDMFTELYD